MTKEQHLNDLVKKIFSCTDKSELKDVVKDINKFVEDYSIVHNSKDYKKLENSLGIMKLKLKKSSSVKESMNEIIGLNEELDLSGYSDEDFIEVFVEYFRPWIRKTHGDEIGKYPMSLLVKKYLEEFNKDYDINDYLGYGNMLGKMAKVGFALARKGVRKLPSLNKGILFTEKFKRSIDHFFSAYNFPDFVKLRFEENSPFNVYGYLEIEFEPAMKYEGNLSDISKFGTEFIKFIETYLGFERGSTAHGKLNISMASPRFVGQEEWINKFFNKTFKKEIKKFPYTQSYLHSVKLEIQAYNGAYGKILLTFKRSASWTAENRITEEIKGYLQGLGYNTNNLRVEKK